VNTAGGPLRIVLAGDWVGGIYEEPMARALESLGHCVVRFKWSPYFGGGDSEVATGLAGRIQNRFLFGPRFARLNRDLADLCARTSPDLFLLRRGTHVTRLTLQTVRERVSSAVIAGLCNDDPFSPKQDRILWRHFLAAVPEYDFVLAYRHHNVEDFRRIGARRIELLRSWYVPDRTHPLDLSEEERRRWSTDVVFAGHYEPDKRIEYLDALVASGVSLKVYGPEYPAGLRAPCLSGSLPVRALKDGDYNKALCGARIALCFFSTLNRDTYTRRCFEIPSTGTAMLCEYSADVATLFREGEEVEFFRSKEELVGKAKALLADPERCARIGAAGRRRVVADRHDVVSRMRQLLGWVTDVRVGASSQVERPAEAHILRDVPCMEHASVDEKEDSRPVTAPFLSICIPSFNRPKHLETLLGSIDVAPSTAEIVICEDCAPRRNEVREVVERFRALSPYRVTYVENERNLGYDANLRQLIRNAAGEWVVFMGDDDLFVPGALDSYAAFVASHREAGYILRTYRVRHENGRIEDFRYFPASRTFEKGAETYVTLFRRSVTLPGFTFRRELAGDFLSDRFDGTLLYQIYLMAEIVLRHPAVYCDICAFEGVQTFRLDRPFFGSSDVERRYYEPGRITPRNSLNFMKGYLRITEYLDCAYGLDSTERVRKDLSKYSYPILSIQRKRGAREFLAYARALEDEIGLGVTPYFRLYKVALLLFGEAACDRVIGAVKSRMGRTPGL
jgi:spore maturation protein CgeB